MTDPFEGGPKARPDHPDFWRLAEIVLQVDGQAVEAGMRFDDMAAEIIHPESLAYMALQRAMRRVDAKTQAQLAENATEIMRMTTVYYEAFIVGYRYHERKAQ